MICKHYQLSQLLDYTVSIPLLHKILLKKMFRNVFFNVQTVSAAGSNFQCLRIDICRKYLDVWKLRVQLAHVLHDEHRHGVSFFATAACYDPHFYGVLRLFSRQNSGYHFRTEAFKSLGVSEKFGYVDEELAAQRL